MNPIASSRRAVLRRRCLRWTAAIVTFAALAGCASPPVAPGGAAPQMLAHLESIVRLSATGRPVVLEAMPPQVNVGQPLRLNVTSTSAGHLYVFQLGTSGNLSLIFPNGVDGANQVGAGHAQPLPRPNWSLTARGPAGLSHLLAVVSEQPQDLMALQRHLAEQRVQVEGPYGAAWVTIREVAP